MTIHSSQKNSQTPPFQKKKTPKKTLLRQLGNLLTGDRTPVTPVTDTRNQPTTIEASVVLPFSPPPVFIDYAAEGDEPADLALVELIPTGLKALNLPYVPTTTEDRPAEPLIEDKLCQLTCSLTDRPTSAEAMNQAVAAADLTDLTPMELTSLNIPPRQAESQKRLDTYREDLSEIAISERLRKNTLEQNEINQGTDYQIASQSEVYSQITAKRSPLPDLSTLKKSIRESSIETSSIATVRVPTAYLQQLEQIVEGLLHQQHQQSRHNEQLGALVKQLLSQVAQQQTELTRLGKGNYDDVQQTIQTCLTSH